jgi:hypothetical protein
MSLILRQAATTVAVVLATSLTGCYDTDTKVSGDERIRLDYHSPLPELPRETTQVATGTPTGHALKQPIRFPHYQHATVLEMDCQYCHSDARKSLHAGVPPVKTCIGCHQFVATDKPEIQRLLAYGPYSEDGKANTPIPWKKVHDLPDFVYFTHRRHVQGGVQCTECHGQTQLQGQKVPVRMPKSEAQAEGLIAMAGGGSMGGAEDAHDGATEGEHHEGEHHEGGHGHEEFVTVERVQKVYARETSMQMGWCLNCHGTHPSIDENYGENANIRRAEIKDCWTCHK